jgi:nickel-dependent lactate racemase
MKIALKYGHKEYGFNIPDTANVSFLKPGSMPVLDSLEAAVRSALDTPLGCERFDDGVRRQTPHTVAIAVPDESRAVPVKEILPVLLEQLYSALPTLEPSAVSIVVGGGLHTPLDNDGLQKIVPPATTPGCRVIAHDPVSARFVDFGATGRGTPVRINSDVAEADFKIVIGQIDPHQFVGFTGGAKGIVIGCASHETIERNHSLMSHEGAQVGVIQGNPAREDMNEAGLMVGIDFAVNVVLDADQKAVELIAGEPTSVLAKGAEVCSSLYGVALEEEFDIAIASCGGHPKDICLYQAQKGLNMASRAVRQGGKILLLAAAPQGIGDDAYFSYVSQFSTPEEVLADFATRGFEMGAHKAFLFARTLANYDVAVFSGIDTEILKRCHLTAADPESTIKKWVEEFDGAPRVAVVPSANSTYFYRA